jgi:glycosyltransferase involved in cell wall biosynthesis
MSKHRVSVIIPNYNREALIGETLDNLLAQTQAPHEIIVVDDGSIDGSVAAIRSFGDKVTLIEQSNQGPGAARNAGLRVATGEFIQFQDSDDLFSLNKLETQSRLLAESGADIAFGPWVKVRIENRRVTFENHVLQQNMPSESLSLPCWWLRGWSTVFQSLMFRRDFLDRAGFYRTDLMPSEDSEYFFRALTLTPRVAFSREALMLYRLHTLNKITQDQGTPQARRIIDWARCLQYVLDRCESSGVRRDGMTHAIFISGIRKHLRYLQALPDAPAELIHLLSMQVAKMPGLYLNAVELGLRLTEQARLRLRGSRWVTAYQAAAPTPAQMKLIRELGFEVTQAGPTQARCICL